jgi:hypothetical protein
MTAIYKLSNAHRPALATGAYELAVSWKVEIDGYAGKVESTESVQFSVASERFALNPSEIESVYPPEGSTGDYSLDLPHVALNRDTLPWERSAKAGSDAPWLALLLLTQDEAAQSPLKTMTLKTFKDTLAAYSPAVAVELEPGQEKESVNVIELPRDVPGGVLPQLRELSVLCHNRVAEEAGKVVNAAAVVTGKRLPSAGRNTVHLVMLENRFTGEDFPLPANASSCALISLMSWSFTSQSGPVKPEEQKSLDAPLKQLGVGWLELNTVNATASNYQKAGFVPLPHWFRSGESGASWYGGPLRGGVPILQAQDAAQLVKLPAPSADSLLWYDEHLGMLNITYAAAWELGRLLAMQNRSMFSLLYKWRRQQIHCHQAASEAAHDAECSHLPQIQCACAQAAAKPPRELTEWLAGLRRLQGIPTRYLLPDERLLPPDSIRFVSMDQHYIDALLDGVLSSVRGPSLCPERCRQGELELLAGNHPEVVSGFLLRSAAVAGLSGLEATAVGVNQLENLEGFPSRLSPSIRLFLFKGKADQVTLRQRSDAIHLTVKHKGSVAWSNAEKRALAISGTSSSAFAKAMLDQPEELTVNVNW